MEENGKTVIQVKVAPRSSRNHIVGEQKGVYKVKLTAPPVEGRANKALKELLAKKLGLPKGNIEIISGERSRTKSIRIYGLSLDGVERRLNLCVC